MSIDRLNGMIDRLSGLVGQIGQVGQSDSSGQVSNPGQSEGRPGQHGLDRAEQARRMGQRMGRGRRQGGCSMKGMPAQLPERPIGKRPTQDSGKPATKNPSQVLGTDGPAKDAFRMAADPSQAGRPSSAFEEIIAALRELADALLNRRTRTSEDKAEPAKDSEVAAENGGAKEGTKSKVAAEDGSDTKVAAEDGSDTKVAAEDGDAAPVKQAPVSQKPVEQEPVVETDPAPAEDGADTEVGDASGDAAADETDTDPDTPVSNENDDTGRCRRRGRN